MKLNENNDVAFIKNELMELLSRQQGGRNIQKALRQARLQLLTPQMGDRPDVPNVCLILTTANNFQGLNQFRFLSRECQHLFVLNDGGYKDLQQVHAALCPGKCFRYK